MAKDRSAVHAELRPMAQFLPRLPFRRWNIPLLQRLMRLQPGVKPPAGVLVEDVWASRAEGGAPPLRLRIYQPAERSAPTPALVWMHGGGYFIGRPEQNDPHLFCLVQQLGIVILSVDYRLAPAHPFPAPLEDGYTALTWAHSCAGLLKIDPQRLVVGGESAGGGLAASLAQLAHDRGEVQPVFQLLIYPMLDDRTVLRPKEGSAEHLLWSPENNRLGWELYLNQPVSSAPLPPYAAAARRADLSGLPPAWIGVGTLDLFYAEDLAYAQRLRDSGVDCETTLVPGAFHGFDQFGAKLKVVHDFREAQVNALRKALFGG